MLKLTGILIVALGFALRLNTLLAVLAAGIVTGLIAGFSLNDIMSMLGTFFIENRFMSLPVILMMPVPPPPNEAIQEGRRLTELLGWTLLLPQMLAAIWLFNVTLMSLCVYRF